LLNICTEPTSREQLQVTMGIKDRKYFHEAYLSPAIKGGFLEMTLPDKPQSSKQENRLTAKGKSIT
ncbi:MAG: AAA family ATPase, partial [Spirochaetales bacterium]|nr:AAA family ATPase [Spirochaetales bacterium]